MSLRRPSRLRLVLLAAALTLACSSRPGVQQQTPPPTITFESPVEASYVHGSISVTAKAQGVATIKTFTFTAPTTLGAAAPTLDPVNHAATLSTTLDLSPFPDGALKITVTAKDDLGGTTSKDLTVNVAAKAPTITIGSPSAGAIVAGPAVAVTATAAAQTGATITKLELIAPPAGLGTNTSAAAAFFAATWNSTMALEGSATLHFRATDSTGLIGDGFATVTVDNVPLGQLETYVFAGAPVKDAMIEVWALSNATGTVDTAAGTSGLLGRGGPTDAAGRALVTLSAENYSGPVQLRARAASGTTLQYVDPADPGSGYIQIPSALTLTSILSSYTTGQALPAPITLTTTLADVELLAYAAGSHRLHPTTRTIVEAAAYADGLFTQHVQSSTPRWKLRTTVPVDLTAGPTTLTDRAYAAFIDIALNQLGKDLGTQVHVSGVINAPFLVSKLTADLAGDGQLDGKGGGGTAITTQTGSPPYAFDENTLRVRLANALDTWVQSPRNQSTLDRSTLSGAGIYTTISADTSELFGPAAPSPFDNMPPSVTTLVTYGPTLVTATTTPYSGTYVSRITKIVVTANDPSGVKSVSVKFGAQSLDGSATTVLSPDGQTLVYTGTVNTTTFSDLSYMLAVTTTDQRNNTATTTAATLTVDNTPPTVSQTQPVATTYYSATVPFDGTASDGGGSGVASLTATGFTGLVDTDSAAAHVYGAWTPPVTLSDGLVAGTWSTCDNVSNCATPAVSFQLDRVAPSVAGPAIQPLYVATGNVTIVATAGDATSGVQAIYAQRAGALGTPASCTPVSGSCSLAVGGLIRGGNSILLWASDNATPPNVSSSGATAVSVIYDNSPPTVLDAKGLVAFTSEQGLTAQTNPDGTATFPAVYALAPGAATGFNKTTGTVYRSSARVGAVPASAAEIETAVANTRNIPAIQYRVSYVPGRDAPITAISAAVTVNDGVTTTTVSGVPLLQSSIDTYDLPLTSATIPALATVTANAAVTVVISMTNAVGLSGNDLSSAFTFTWSLLAPPLVVHQDTAWADGRDGGSAYAFKSNSAAYFSAWNPANAAFVGGNVRLARYVVENPSATPAALALSGSVSSRVAGSSPPVSLPTEVAENGIGSTSNPGALIGVVHPSEPYNGVNAAPAGAYWTTTYIPGCGTADAGLVQIDPACDPAVSYCATLPNWPASPGPQCAPGAAMLPYGRAIHEAILSDGSSTIPIERAGWYTQDGFRFYRNWGYPTPWTGALADGSMPNADAGAAACTPGSRFPEPQRDPRTPDTRDLCTKAQIEAGYIIRHVIGDTVTRVVCAPPAYMSGPAATWYFASTPASVSAWADPVTMGGERNPATPVGGSVLVPAATGAGPGRIVLYVARPASSPSPAGQFSPGALTGAARMEKLVAHWWQDPGVVNLRFIHHRAGWSTNKYLYWCENHVMPQMREAAVFDTMQEVLNGSISLTARPATPAALLGANVVLPPLIFSSTAVGSR